MIGTLGGLKIELSKEELLWLVQNSNGNGKHEPRYGDPVDEGNHAPMDELTAIEEHLNKRNPGAFLDQEDLVNEAEAARAEAYARFALNGAGRSVVVMDDQHEGVPVAAEAPVPAAPESPVPQTSPAS